MKKATATSHGSSRLMASLGGSVVVSAIVNSPV
jgi:hypothetical protein